MSGTEQFAVTQKTTLEEYLLPWHELRAPAQAAKYSRAQQGLILKHIVPGIGKRKLGSITPRDLETFYAALQHQDPRRQDTLGKPLGDSMKRQIHNLLHLAFNDAVRHGDLMRHPADTARPRYTQQAAQDDTFKSWTEEEASKFYTVARVHSQGVVFCFMLSTGIRIAEALGLRWEHVDLQTGAVRVEEALVSLGGHLHRTTPKTNRSRRTIHVAGDALAILQEQLEVDALKREAKGESYVGSGSVFTNSLGTPILPDNVYRTMKQLCKAADVEYKGTHVLRHSFISIQGQQGRSVEVISAHVGHARPSFTRDRYRTVFDEERKGLTLDSTALKKETESSA
ncbi:tyrosine-type recombinase/integrase [Deinococcus frigens]|uniref:tyrosine-type recombinase/integrase n=1 Tax=Deinococcus frigens TaxID=249403 RepID=UPI001FE0C0D9|nr:site-specific integrase [Deinococcus frigens]